MKNKKAIILLAAVILATSFFAAIFAACGDADGGSTGVTYTLGVTGGSFSVTQGKTAVIGFTLAASDGSSTAGITVTCACASAGHTSCGVSVNAAGTQISATAGATAGNHAFTATAVKGGATVATKGFTILVVESDYGIEIPPVTTVQHNKSGDIFYTLAAPGGNTSGLTVDVSACTAHQSCGLSVTKHATQARFVINTVPETVEKGDHTFSMDVKKDGVVKATESFIVKVLPSYDLTVDDVSAAQGETVTIAYTLRPSDGSSTDGYIVGIYCLTDYESCPLIDDDPANWGNLTIVVPPDATIGDHGMSMRVETAEYEFVTEAEFTFTVTSSAVRTVTVAVTLEGEDAQLEDGEFVWIMGGFYNPGSWSSHLLEKQTNGTWTRTFNDISSAFTEIKYNVLAVKSNTEFEWKVSASANDVVFPLSPGNNAINYTVTEWHGRPVVIAGNLLLNYDFTESAGWNLDEVTHWTITGLNTTGWLSGFQSISHSGDRCFVDFNPQSWQSGDIYTQWLDSGGTLKIVQDVDASSNGLTDGQDVTLSVWIKRVSKNQADVKLLVGAQESPISLTDATWTWEQYSHTFTLTAADIVGGKITVGLQYTASNGQCYTAVDDFIFEIAE